MPTDFINELYFPDDDSVGEIKTITTLKVWDCKKAKWSNKPNVVLRNTLLFALHPTIPFCIGEIDKTDTNPALLNPFTPPGKNMPTVYLDLASNSRTHGRFTFSAKPVGKHYYSEEWRCIIYGSIMHTGCKKLVYRDSQYVIVDDELRDEDGDQLDDPINNINWSTGDSHGKADSITMALLDLPADDDGDNNDDDDDNFLNPLQYRASLLRKWVGKGTFAHSLLCDINGKGFIQPHSSMKGRKPALGNYVGKLLIGKVFSAEKRTARGGWMLFQWFDFNTLEQDRIIKKIEDKAKEIVGAYDNVQELAKFLRIEQETAEDQINDSDDGFTSIAEYENMMIRIIRADKKGILLLHPYVIKRIEQRLQSAWLKLAKSAGVRFFSVMTMPDEHFAQYYTVNPDGRIIGDKKFCSPDFYPGQYIIFANPMRHWGDVQLWENVWEGYYLGDTGILATGKDLLLSLGRDTDGDFIQIARANKYPNIRDAIAQFDESPVVKKLPKVPLKGTFQEIAIGSMNDLTGVVATLLGRAKGSNSQYHTLLIPPFPPYQPQAEERRIIDFLSQELQIAVDSLKSAYPNHKKGLDAVKFYLDGIDNKSGIPWLSDFKSPECYKNRPCFVNPKGADTISRIVRLVNSYFKVPSLQVNSNARDYENTLFNDYKPSEFQLKYAINHRNNYWQEIADAIAWKNANDHDTTQIREVAEKAKASREKIYAVEDKNGNLFDPKTWVSAYWKVSHQVNSGDAGLVFLIFPEEIIQELGIYNKTVKWLEVYGVQDSKWQDSTGTFKWKGEKVIMKIVWGKTFKGKQTKAVEIFSEDAKILTGFNYLGLVGQKQLGEVAIGETKAMKIWDLRRNANRTIIRAVMLFDPAQLTTDEMLRLLAKNKYKI